MTKSVYKYVKSKIIQLDEDTSRSKALCAKLRRGIGKHPGALPDIWEITLSDLPDEMRSQNKNPSYAEWAIHTALTLYALHRQGKTESMNGEHSAFGTAVAMLVTPDRSNLDAVKRRFDATITATDFTELAYHARGLISLLKAKDIKLNYPQFAEELYSYQLNADSVRLRWGENFYGALSKTNKNEKGDQNEQI